METFVPELRESLGSRGALVIAHPGHELRIHGILEETRPCVHVLTDGSGHSDRSRLASTQKILGGAGCQGGSVFGDWSDRALYQALLSRDVGLFGEVATRIARGLVNGNADWVAGDAVEGYNPSHDVCSLLMRAAVTIARRETGRTIRCFDFLLVAPPTGDRRHRARTDGFAFWLDDSAYSRKLAAAQSYLELASEVEAQLARTGEDGFRTEWLWPVDPAEFDPELEEVPPFYERHGRDRVREGIYDELITYADHVRPVAEALGELAAA